MNTVSQVVAYEYLAEKIRGLWQGVGTVFEINDQRGGIDLPNVSKFEVQNRHKEFKITNDKGATLLKTTYDWSGALPKYSIETSTLKAEVNNDGDNSKITLTEYNMGLKLSEIQYTPKGKQIVDSNNQLKPLEPFTKNEGDIIIDKFLQDKDFVKHFNNYTRSTIKYYISKLPKAQQTLA